MARLKAAADALGQARADVDQLRDRVADLAAERQRVVNAPCDEAEAGRRIDDMIARARAEQILAPTAVKITSANGRVEGHLLDHSMATSPFAVLAAVVPDQLRAAILAEMPGGGLGQDERVARLAALDRDLLATEIAEEVACREIEAATGGVIPRRQDANPAVLLAPTDELEGGPYDAE